MTQIIHSKALLCNYPITAAMQEIIAQHACYASTFRYADFVQHAKKQVPPIVGGTCYSRKDNHISI
jgi:hypothetical protein